ncbi:hypothetical protein [Arthrobacter sp. efr-133-R2A-63]|uniref:hypothetical protein n=1 Tax=Arthrobacter sp. efr-133-R2A-63 TaxID=3040278 RepID=UPI0025504ACB|nr:hypothetical protein [Arthrobacter sp. efr-133-R2A-63]
MATFAAHVFVHGESGPVHFAPGDELPEWAESLVGKHCLVPEVETDAPDFTAGGAEDGESNPEGTDSDPADDADKGNDDGDKEGEGKTDEGDDFDPAAKTDAPDFTAPAPRRGRPRKA